MILHRLEKDGLINPPKFLVEGTQYLCAMGSTAYGVAGEKSDLDCYGWTYPDKAVIFPHTAGHVRGYGENPPNFESYQEHHVKSKEGKEYDFQIYSVVKFFDLLRINTPNATDALFVPDRCVLFASDIGKHVRENRRVFLHKGAYHKFRGYAYSQLQKTANKKKADNDDRQADIDAFGYDVKSGYHVVRLALQCQQILEEGDLQLDRNAELLKAIRRGEWTLDRLKEWFAEKEIHLERAYSETKLPAIPDEAAIKALLLNVLEAHYGSLSAVVQKENDISRLVKALDTVIAPYRSYGRGDA